MAKNRIKLSKFAEEQNIAYITAYRHWQKGNIDGMQIPGGTILVTGWKQEEETKDSEKELAIVYSRVSSNNQKLKLKTQTAHMVKFGEEQGYKVVDTVEEIGSSFSDRRPKLMSILYRNDWNVLIVESNSSLMKFGYPYFEALLKKEGKKIISHQAETETETSILEGSKAENSGELEIVILVTAMRELMKPLIGVGGQKQRIENFIGKLFD